MAGIRFGTDGEGRARRVWSTRQGAFLPLREVTSFALGLRRSAECALSIRHKEKSGGRGINLLADCEMQVLKRRKSDRCRVHVQHR